MLNLIKADLYKVFNRAYMYVFLGIMVVLSIAANVLLKTANVPVTAYDIMQMGLDSLIIPIFLVIMFVDITASEEIKDGILKNTVAFGISRVKLYISKIVSSVILAFISAFVILTAFIGSAFLIFEPGKHFTGSFAADFSYRILSAIPLYIAAIVICMMLAFIIKKNMLFAFTYAALFVVINLIVKVLYTLVSEKFLWVYNLLITRNLKFLSGDIVTSTQMLTAAGIGFAYAIIFTLMGIMVFKKQELK